MRVEKTSLLLLEAHFPKVFRAVEVRRFEIDRGSRQVVFARSFIAAFVHIRRQIAFKSIVSIEQPNEIEGNAIEDFPAVGSSVRLNIEILGGVSLYNIDAI